MYNCSDGNVPAERAGRVAEADDRRGVVPVADTHCQVTHQHTHTHTHRHTHTHTHTITHR